MIQKRKDAILFDCGCLTWIEGEKLVYLPCGQDGCRVYNIVLEQSRERGNEIITMRAEAG